MGSVELALSIRRELNYGTGSRYMLVMRTARDAESASVAQERARKEPFPI